MYVKEGTFASPSADVAVNVYASESTNTGLNRRPAFIYAYCKAVMPGGINQTEKAQTCVAKEEYLAVTSITASMPEAASPTGTAAADVELEVKRKGGVFRPVGAETAVGVGFRTVNAPLDPPVIVPPNSDIRLVAKASNDRSSCRRGYQWRHLQG